MIYLSLYLFIGFCIYGYALRTKNDTLVLICGLFVGPVDIFLNYTFFALLTWDFPKGGEMTFSDRLNRLVKDTGWRGFICRPVARTLNLIVPNHIENV